MFQASPLILEADSFQTEDTTLPSAVYDGENSLGLFGCDSFPPQATSHDLPERDEEDIELPRLSWAAKGKWKASVEPADVDRDPPPLILSSTRDSVGLDQHIPDPPIWDAENIAYIDDAVDDDFYDTEGGCDAEHVEGESDASTSRPTTAASIRKQDRNAQGLQETHACMEGLREAELEYYDREIEFRRSEPPNITALLEQSTSRWQLPSVDPRVLNLVESNPAILSLVQALAQNPITVDPNEWKDILIECEDDPDDDDRGDGRVYIRFYREDNILSALEALDLYDETYPADVHRTAVLRQILEELLANGHLGPVWHVYGGVTCAGPVSHRLEEDEGKLGPTRYLNFSNVLRRLNRPAKWRIFEIVPLRQKLTESEQLLRLAIVRIGANRILNDLERMVIAVLGQPSWNSAVGGMEQGDYVPEANIGMLLSKVPTPLLHSLYYNLPIPE